jgi:hypothetical protein
MGIAPKGKGRKMMKSGNEAVGKLAEEIAERISKKTILALQEMSITLTPEDSGLINPWDEICVQMQGEKFYFWEPYDMTTRELVAGCVEGLKEDERLALWFQTEQGGEWICGDEGKRSECPPASDDDIVQYLVQRYVYDKAGDWNNERISAYLER